MASGEPFYLDPSFWVAGSTAVFAGIIVVKGGLKKMGEMLDAKSAEIARQIEEARTLRDEAEIALGDMQRRQREAEDEAASVVAQAEDDAKLMIDAAKVDLDNLLARRRKLAEQKIAQLEAAAIKDVQNAAADAAVDAARQVIAESQSAKDKNGLVDRAIADVEKRVH